MLVHHFSALRSAFCKEIQTQMRVFFTGQASMSLDLPTKANDFTSAEGDIVKLETCEENPLAEDVTKKRSNPSGGYNVLFCPLFQSQERIATLLHQSS